MICHFWSLGRGLIQRIYSMYCTSTVGVLQHMCWHGKSVWSLTARQVDVLQWPCETSVLYKWFAHNLYIHSYIQYVRMYLRMCICMYICTYFCVHVVFCDVLWCCCSLMVVEWLPLKNRECQQVTFSFQFGISPVTLSHQVHSQMGIIIWRWSMKWLGGVLDHPKAIIPVPNNVCGTYVCCLVTHIVQTSQVFMECRLSPWTICKSNYVILSNMSPLAFPPMWICKSCLQHWIIPVT